MTKKVLIADDEEGVLALISATLEGDDRIEVFLGENGEEALEMAMREKPDLVFLDIMMPKKTGYEVCQSLKQNPETAHTTVVMLTAQAQDADKQRAWDAGADDYFTKPFSPTRLLNKIEEILEIK